MPNVPTVLTAPHCTYAAVKTWVKIAPLALIFFCASFNLTILQNLKDAIMVTTAGAEVRGNQPSYFCAALPPS